MKVQVDYMPTNKSVVYELPPGATTSDLKNAIFENDGEYDLCLSLHSSPYQWPKRVPPIIAVF